MDNHESIKYADDNDKCYGLAGMTIALAIYDKEHHIESVSADRADIDSISFYTDFFYVVNQHLSAKAAWRAMIEHFRVVSGMILSNVMCRNMVMHRREVPRNQIDELLALIADEGRDVYQLEEDECRNLLGNNYNELYRVFSHPTIHSVAHELSRMLVQRRTLTHFDLLDVLAPLG